ncbi:hypothetical protein FOA43_000913 [Brettanomyces nanus]|uniref:Uncharacterized protein n=1 Tax=Eeniella nana TaxID=13502 RepID=A0A875RWG7_EENNA|nr:uncharacterized protein FOA43_000913 [Brettanomyces nanus]QPG73601.1 hypothetical protein FOA43_000913 [Brettanomyces nanus]
MALKLSRRHSAASRSRSCTLGTVGGGSSSLSNTGSSSLDLKMAAKANLQNLQSQDMEPIASPDEEDLVLLPIDPVDKSIPPCSSEELTPIIPLTLEELQESLSMDLTSPLLTRGEFFTTVDTLPHNNQRSPISRKRPLIISTLSTTSTTATLATATSVNADGFDLFSDDTTCSGGYSVSSNGVHTPSSISNVNITNNSINNNHSPGTTNSIGLYSILKEEEYKDHVDPLFFKANQIDHFDRHLDRKNNDKLADQMALNILHNIAEEEADELTKLREEIPVHFSAGGAKC